MHRGFHRTRKGLSRLIGRHRHVAAHHACESVSDGKAQTRLPTRANSSLRASCVPHPSAAARPRPGCLP
jgi:hypothetical protein